MGDSEVVRLAQELYEKHERAINLIYKHRPNVDVRAQIKEMIVSLIKDEPKLALDKTQKGGIRFAVREWDTPALLIPEGFPRGWTPSGHMLLFQVTNDHNVLNLHLFLGPGPEETRQKLLGMVRSNEPDVFVLPRATGTWIPIYHHPMILPEVYDKLTREQREQEIRRHWDEFLDNDLPRIEEALRREAWIWESAEYD